MCGALAGRCCWYRLLCWRWQHLRRRPRLRASRTRTVSRTRTGSRIPIRARARRRTARRPVGLPVAEWVDSIDRWWTEDLVISEDRAGGQVLVATAARRLLGA